MLAAAERNLADAQLADVRTWIAANKPGLASPQPGTG
jgi:hypothetical protein